MLAEARKRIADHPGKYVGRIYGETENGGTSYLILSHVPFEQLGLPRVPSTPVSGASEAVMKGTLPFAAGWAIALTAVAGGVRLYKREVRRTPGSPPDESPSEAAPAPEKEQES
jgi:hypothetical protein